MVARIPGEIEVYGARVHNLRSVDVRVPLHKIVGIAGVSGSGKSSLALGVLYAEGSRRYLEALSTYTRRRLSQDTRADVDEVLYVPAALARTIETVKEATGIDIREIMRADTYDAKVTKNVNVTGLAAGDGKPSPAADNIVQAAVTEPEK